MSDRAIGSASQAAAAARSGASDMARGVASAQWPYWVAGLVVLGGLAAYFLTNTGVDKVAELPRPVPTQPSMARPETVGVGQAGLTVDGVNLVSRVNESIGELKAALVGVTDTASAGAALPKIKDAMARLDEVGKLSAKLPPEGKTALGSSIAAVMPTINPLFDKVLATPGAGDIAKPAIDELRAKLDMLARG